MKRIVFSMVFFRCFLLCLLLPETQEEDDRLTHVPKECKPRLTRAFASLDESIMLSVTRQPLEFTLASLKLKEVQIALQSLIKYPEMSVVQIVRNLDARAENLNEKIMRFFDDSPQVRLNICFFKIII